MDKAAVEAFFAAYQQAFTTFDTAGICSRFSYPAAIANGQDTTVLPSYETFFSDVEGFFATYRDMGMADAVLRRLDIDIKSPAYAIADISWALVDAQGDEVLAFDASYVLGRHGGGDVRIVFILAHNELERSGGKIG